MNCKELVYLLADYLDGSMEEHLRNDLEAHIAMCESCQNFLNTYDRTRIICGKVRLDEIPDEFRDRLRSFVLEKAQEYRREIAQYRTAAAEEQKEKAEALLLAYRQGRLSPALSLAFETHREQCAVCGAYLRDLNGGREAAPRSEEIEQHLAGLFDEISPGEDPFLS